MSALMVSEVGMVTLTALPPTRLLVVDMERADVMLGNVAVSLDVHVTETEAVGGTVV